MGKKGGQYTSNRCKSQKPKPSATPEQDTTSAVYFRADAPDGISDASSALGDAPSNPFLLDALSSRSAVASLTLNSHFGASSAATDYNNSSSFNHTTLSESGSVSPFDPYAAAGASAENHGRELTPAEQLEIDLAAAGIDIETAASIGIQTPLDNSLPAPNQVEIVSNPYGSIAFRIREESPPAASSGATDSNEDPSIEAGWEILDVIG